MFNGIFKKKFIICLSIRLSITRIFVRSNKKVEIVNSQACSECCRSMFSLMRELPLHAKRVDIQSLGFKIYILFRKPLLPSSDSFQMFFNNYSIYEFVASKPILNTHHMSLLLQNIITTNIYFGSNEVIFTLNRDAIIL